MTTKINTSAEFKSQTIDVKKVTEATLDFKFKNDVAGQIIYSESGNDAVITVLGQKVNAEYESYQYTKTHETADVNMTNITISEDPVAEGEHKGLYKVDYKNNGAGDFLTMYVTAAQKADLEAGKTHTHQVQITGYNFEAANFTDEISIENVFTAAAHAPAADVVKRYINGSQIGEVYVGPYPADNGEDPIIVDPTKVYGMVTFKNAGGVDYADPKTILNNINVATASNPGVDGNLLAKEFDAQEKGTAFTGNVLGELAASTIANETFALGSGNDRITFYNVDPDLEPGKTNLIAFGQDAITLTAGEDLMLDLNVNGSKSTIATTDQIVIGVAENKKDVNVSVYETATMGYEKDVITAVDHNVKKYVKNSTEYSADTYTKTYKRVTYTASGAVAKDVYQVKITAIEAGHATATYIDNTGAVQNVTGTLSTQLDAKVGAFELAAGKEYRLEWDTDHFESKIETSTEAEFADKVKEGNYYVATAATEDGYENGAWKPQGPAVKIYEDAEVTAGVKAYDYLNGKLVATHNDAGTWEPADTTTKYYLKTIYTNAVYNKTTHWDGDTSKIAWSAVTDPSLVPATMTINEFVTGHETIAEVIAVYHEELETYDVDTEFYFQDVQVFKVTDAAGTLDGGARHEYYAVATNAENGKTYWFTNTTIGPDLTDEYYDYRIKENQSTVAYESYADYGKQDNRTESYLGTATLANLAAKDVLGTGSVVINYDGTPGNYINVVEYIGTHAAEIQPDAKHVFTGTYMSDTATSTKENETFDLKASTVTGDTVKFTGDFGTDTVIVTEGEKINLHVLDTKGDFTTTADVTYTHDGKNVIIATQDVEYTATFTASESFKVNGKDFVKDQEYAFTLGYNETSKKYVWTCQGVDLTYAELTTKAGTSLSERQVTFNKDGGGTSVQGLTFLKTVDDEVSILDDTELKSATYFAGVTDADKASAATKRLIDHENTTGSIILKNYVTKDPKEFGIFINNTNLNTVSFDAAYSKGKFTGTRLNELALSTVDDETFNLKGGNDTIELSLTGYGLDKVTLTEGETVNLVYRDFNGNQVDMYNNGAFNCVTYAKAPNNKDLGLATKTQYSVTLTDKTNPLTHYEFVLTNVDDKYVWQDATTTPGTVYTLTTDNMKTIYNNGAMDGSVEIKPGVTVKFTAGGADTVTQYLYNNFNDTWRQIAIVGNTVDDVKGIFADAANISEYWYENAVSTVTLTNYLAKPYEGAISVSGDPMNTDDEYVALLTYTSEELQASNGKYTGSSASDIVNAATYVSPDGVKGVTVNTGSGNDDVTGSAFNDTINVKSIAFDVTNVTETAGVNRITTGKGNDTINANGFSSNTINAGAGFNTINVASVGTNKITAGNDGNALDIDAGVNTIKLGNGVNNLDIDGGVNTITTGKANDIIDIAGASNNVVKSGAGNDVITIAGGSSTVDAGAGNDRITLTGGFANVKGGAGDDSFYITNAVGSRYIIDGGAGKDSYDLTAFDFTEPKLKGDVIITDKQGDIDLALAAQKSIFFDVTVNSKTGAIKNVGTSLTFFEDTDGDHLIEGATATLNIGKKTTVNVEVGANDYVINTSQVAEAVANWLNSNANTSGLYTASEVMNTDLAAALGQVYIDNAAKNYVQV